MFTTLFASSLKSRLGGTGYPKQPIKPALLFVVLYRFKYLFGGELFEISQNVRKVSAFLHRDNQMQMVAHSLSCLNGNSPRMHLQTFFFLAIPKAFNNDINIFLPSENIYPLHHGKRNKVARFLNSYFISFSHYAGKNIGF